MPKKKDLEMLDVEPTAMPGREISPYTTDDQAAKDAASTGAPDGQETSEEEASKEEDSS